MAQNLRTPGPTPLPAEVKAALARDMVNHRGPEFAEVLRDCVAGLQWAFDTHNDVLVLTASGTGGLESIVVNTLSPGGRVLVVSIGYFGDRFATIARAFGASVEQLSFPWGRAAHPGQVAERLAADPTLKTVFVTHNETSTGVLNPLADIAAAVREARPEVLLAVDGISSVGSVPIHPDRWQCDVVVAGSQKGWMTPPGLTFVSVSERAWTRQAQARMPRFYFDWQAHRDAMRKGSTPATPAVNLVFGLQAGLAHMRREGLDSIFARHEQVAAFTRAGLVRLGFELFADPTHASPTVTTALPPPDVDVRLLLRRLRERHNVVLAGGQGPYDGRMLRIGHLGDVSEADIAEALAAIEAELPGRRVARLMSHSGGARPRVVVADRIAEAGLQALREQTHVEHLAGRSHDQLLAALAKADALLVRSETHVTRELLDAAPQLRVVGRAGAGVDTIDVEAATARGIVVVNAPGGNAVAAAEHTLALLFALARRVAAADAAIKRGEWSRSSFLGVELTGKTLGLIGLGRVGTEVGRRAIGLEMRVLVYDPYVPSDHIRRSGFEAAELDELLTGADVVSLHVPLTEVTRGILDRQRLALLREGALLINCARGGLVDEGALLSALDTGHLAGAGLDVFSHEPPSADDPLALHPRVVATPHLGASTVEAQVSVAAQVAERGAGRAPRAAGAVRRQRADRARRGSAPGAAVRGAGTNARQARHPAGERASRRHGDHLPGRDRRAQRVGGLGGSGPGHARVDLRDAGQPGQCAPAGAAARARGGRDAVGDAGALHESGAGGGADRSWNHQCGRGGVGRHRERGWHRRLRPPPGTDARLHARHTAHRPARHHRSGWHGTWSG